MLIQVEIISVYPEMSLKDTKNEISKTIEIEESFLREEEKRKIREFLKSKKKILHIAGNPGSGKTNTVKYILKDIKYTYINHLLNGGVKTYKNIIVYDEFDKFYDTQKAECLNFLNKNRSKKIITISNNLLFNQNNLFFKPYTKEDVLFITQKKINSSRISDLIIDFIRIKEKNDLRKVLTVCRNLLSNKKEKNIEIEDLIENKIRKNSIHQQIINEIKESFGEKNKVFKEYKTKCKKLNIEGLDRMDFLDVFENIE